MRIRLLLSVLLVAASSITSVVVSAAASDRVSNVGTPAVCCATADRLPGTAPEPEPEVRSDPVYINGDSLFVGVTRSLPGGSLPDRLRSTGRLVFSTAVVGRSVGGAVESIEATPNTVRVSNVALIGLGNNDIFGSAGGSVASARRQIDRVVVALRASSPDIRIVWVDLSVEAQRERTLRWNQALADAAAEHERFEVCEWRSIALQNPTWLAGDGVHLTSAGYRARRDVLFDCVVGPATDRPATG